MDRFVSARFTGLLATLVVASCAAGVDEMPVVEVSDSAGIRVVHNGVPRDRAPLRPQSREPLVRVGDWEAPYGFFQRITGGVLLRDGSMMILDFGPREVRLYGPEGGFTRLVARQGEGPGEVRFPSDLRRVGPDSVYFWDRRLSRASLVSASGDVIGEVSFSTDGRAPPPNLQRSGDHFVGGFPLLQQEEVLVSGPDAELRTTPLALVRIGGDDMDRDTIAELPGTTYLQIGNSSMSPAVRRQAPWSLSGLGLVLGKGDLPEFRVLDERGAPTMIVRWHSPREPLSADGLYDQAVEIAAIDRDHPMFDPRFLPDSMPAFMHLRTFAETIWVGAAAPFLLPSPRWWVFDFEGRWLATIALEANTDVLDFSQDQVLVRETGELDVQTVAVYPLNIGR